MKNLLNLSRSAFSALLSAAAFGACAGPAWSDVGISTESPTATLHIVGENAQTGKDLRVENLDPPQDEDTIHVIVSDQDGYLHAASVAELADALEQNGGGGGQDDDWRASQDNAELTIDSAIYTNNRIGVNIKVPAYEVDIDGDLRATGSIFASNHVITHATFATSDARYKRDIESFDNGLAQIRALEPKRFRYTDDAPVAQPDELYYGLIAQEAAAVDPTLVDTFSLPVVDQEQSGPTEYLGVDSQRLIFTLISAVKEIDRKNQEIDALKARLDALEALVNATAAVRNEFISDTNEPFSKYSQNTASVAETVLVNRPEPQTMLVENTSVTPVSPFSADAFLSLEQYISNPGGYF